MADAVNGQITDAVTQTNKKKKIEGTLWIVGVVLLSIADYFVQQATSGAMPFKVSAAIVNGVVFIGGTIRWALLFGKKVVSGEVTELPPAPTKPTDVK